MWVSCVASFAFDTRPLAPAIKILVSVFDVTMSIEHELHTGVGQDGQDLCLFWVIVLSDF